MCLSCNCSSCEHGRDSISVRIAINKLLSYRDHMIGGSYVVHPEKANDIDVIVHEYKHDIFMEGRLGTEGFRKLRSGDEKYDEIDHVRITDIYEGTIVGIGKVNVIVVGAIFWAAYVGAIASMRAEPSKYTERDARVELHRRLAREVAAIAKVELPEGAY